MSLRSWGNYPKIESSSYSFSDQNMLQKILDQHENIIGAQENGMHGILLKNGNYKEVRKELQAHNILA